MEHETLNGTASQEQMKFERIESEISFKLGGNIQKVFFARAKKMEVLTTDPINVFEGGGAKHEH